MSKQQTPPAFDTSMVVQTLDRIAELLDGADERLSGQVRAAVLELWQPKREAPPACVWYAQAVPTGHDKELAAHLASAAGAVGRALSGNDPRLRNLAPREAASRIRSATGWLNKRLGSAISPLALAVLQVLDDHPQERLLHASINAALARMIDATTGNNFSRSPKPLRAAIKELHALGFVDPHPPGSKRGERITPSARKYLADHLPE